MSTFISPILAICGVLIILNKKINLRNIIPSVFISFIFIIFWLAQQFIYSSCLSPFFEFTCNKSTTWFQHGLSEVLNNATGAVNKSFNEYTGDLSKEEYLNSFNWVTTWFERNKIEFFEHLVALFVPIIILFIINIKKIKIYKIGQIKFEKKIFYFYLFIFLLTLLGLFIWFIKSPVIRFGVPYLFLFYFFLTFFLFKILFKDQYLSGIGIVLILCLTFNLSKNIIRIKNSEFKDHFFPKILKNNYSETKVNGYTVYYPDPIEISAQSNLCWSTPFICHIGRGKNIKINKINDYLLIINSKNE